MTKGISFAPQKGTLIALACAAAFAAPQAANAQREVYEALKVEGHPLTLQGNISIGYARHKTTGSVGGVAFDGPEKGNVWSGESNIRFSASSKLSQGFIEGMGFSVESGFETSDGTTSGSQGTLASRNTAVGLKTSIGTVFGGRWDTPMKLALANFYQSASSNGLGASSTGFLGTPGLGGGSFTGTLGAAAAPTVVVTLPVGTTLAGVTTTSTAAGTATLATTPTALGNPNGSTNLATTMNFRRRQANTLNYYSPNISGFTFGLQYGPDEEVGAGPSTSKATMWGGTGSYTRGPLVVALSYEKHEDYLWGTSVGTRLGATAGASTNSSDHAFSLGVRYDFGDVLLTGYWERLSYSQSGAAVALRDIEGSKFYTAATWKISGPHSLMGAYGRASSLSCASTAAWATAGGSCADTGAQLYNFLYRYQLDKVSYVNVFYGTLNNDARGNFIATNNQSAGTTTSGNGHKDSGWSIGLQTSF